MDMNFKKKYVNMYFAALWPELLSKYPVSFSFDTHCRIEFLWYNAQNKYYIAKNMMPRLKMHGISIFGSGDL